MDAGTLVRAMPGLDESKAEAVLPHLHAAMDRGEITTLRRAQFFLAQLGHESLSLKYFEEIASGAAYEGRTDLGNTHSGDGRRFKGRGPIQLTGRHNYTKFSHWLGRGDHFVKHPEEVATPKYGFLAVIWYWTQARNCNGYCDRGDFRGLTKAINGGYNGLADREDRLRRIERLGDAVLPSPADPYAILSKTELSAVRRLNALRARANRPPEEGGGWGSASDPGSRKSRAERVKALIRTVLMPRISAAAATGWDKGHRRERFEVLKGVLDDSAPVPPDGAEHEAPPYPGHILSRGDTGEAVRTWQARMHERAWTIEVDGEYGPASEQVCRDFQRQNDLEVDGEVGPLTWEATFAEPDETRTPRSQGPVAGKLASSRPARS
jgi:predicted chitinase